MFTIKRWIITIFHGCLIITYSMDTGIISGSANFPVSELASCCDIATEINWCLDMFSRGTLPFSMVVSYPMNNHRFSWKIIHEIPLRFFHGYLEIPSRITQQLLHQKSRGPPCFARPEAGQHQSADRLWDDRHAAATLRGREVRRVLHRAAAHSETHRRGQRGGELGDAWRC